MDRPDRESKKGKKVPRVPIKTYKWEDVRRSRRQGGYPWTYLNKKPFDKTIDTKHFTMDSLKKNTATTYSSDTVEIQEISDDGKETSERTQSFEIVTEPDDHSTNDMQDQMAIEECEVPETEEFKPDITSLESAESSDNISQYLDKEEQASVKTQENPTMLHVSEPSNAGDDNDQSKQAQSEDANKKRKLSGESGHSKLSLSKLAIVKKIKDKTNKIKVPKISFPTSKLKKHISKKSKNSPPETKKELKKGEVQIQPTDIKPVYIHIPLKPPSGKTDKFSYLEFEEKRAPSLMKKPLKINPAFKEVIKSIKKLNEAKMTQEMQENNQEEKTYETSKKADGDKQLDAEKSPNVEILDLEEQEVNDDVSDENSKDKKKENDDVFKKLFASGPSKSEIKQESAKNEPTQRAKSEEPEQKRKLSLESSYSRKSLSKIGIIKKFKELSEKIKFPSITLPRTGSKKKTQKEKETAPVPIKKEQKKASEVAAPKIDKPVYIHIPLKPAEGESDEFSYLEFAEKNGKTSAPVKKEEEKDVSSPLESPGSVENDGVHFIFLTAPSDDEILDDHSSDVPETPSSENQLFFPHKIEELKELAKDVVDEESPESKRKKLACVKEENLSDKVNIEEIDPQISETVITGTLQVPMNFELKTKTDEQSIKKQIMVDEEDGLKLDESMMQDISKEAEQQELKSSLKAEGSPILRKKVSFKRRSKTNSKEEIYEDIQMPQKSVQEKDVKKEEKDHTKLSDVGNSHSMSVDEEKTYLDDKIIKNTSLEEDYNRWSKLSDHEYEPVNPPPDDIKIVATSPPTVHTVDTEQEPRQIEPSKASSTTSLDRRMLENYHEDEHDVVHALESQIVEAQRVETPPPSSKDIIIDSHTQVQAASTNVNDQTDSRIGGSEGTSKFQKAIKEKASQFKTKLQGIKRPHITMPNAPKFQKPNFQKLKIERPKFHLPKMPETPKINLPHFSLPRRSDAKQSLKTRQLSTESNAGDSKKPIFDFSTYPRLFKKKPKSDSSNDGNEQKQPEFATVPRTRRNKGESNESDRWGGRDIIRIPLHAEDSIDRPNNEREDSQDRQIRSQSENDYDRDREDSVERRMTSHIRYDEDIDIDDEMNEYERENQELHRASPFHQDYNNSRWNHGNFVPEPNKEYMENIKNSGYKVTDLDSPEDVPVSSYKYDTGNNKDKYSSEDSSVGVHRRGVLEEINPDEFFLRQKGISQDNIDVGMYLSSEIREAFRSPVNALSQMQADMYDKGYENRGYEDRSYDDRGYEVRSSNQSLPEAPTKRKPIKKPKRKKTPHVSQEHIKYDESEPEEYFEEIPPSRPKRRSRRNRKAKNDHVIPYQETITVEDEALKRTRSSPQEDLSDLKKSDDVDYKLMYVNQRMEGKEQPDIKITYPYRGMEYFDSYKNNEVDKQQNENKPPAPPRRQKSLKSLNSSEHNSILEDFQNLDRDNNISNVEISLRSESFDKDDVHEYIIPEIKESPKRPVRMRSRTRSQSRTTSQADEENVFCETESLDSAAQVPCVEEPCTQDIRDCMGYAVIDKNKFKDPPLPPPRTPPRRKRSIKSETKFFTVPRPLNDASPPSRPLRNYSTLGQTKSTKKSVSSLDDKENLDRDITQYIEIEDEPNRDLHSGEVIQKMRDRPLPAPPRPPRKSKVLRDITSQENIMSNSQEDLNNLKTSTFDEIEVSTQTEPLPEDFECEETIIETTDSIFSPSSITKPTTDDEQTITVERRLITPTHYTHEETVTHAALVVQPLNGAKIVPDSELTKQSHERIIPISQDTDNDETSEIPEEFKMLRDPQAEKEETHHISSVKYMVQPDAETKIELLKAQKLQVSDLDVDRLTVNELMANKIIVSEIDSGLIQTCEISSRTGALKVGEIELPPGVVHEILERLKAVVAEEQASSSIDPLAETKKPKEQQKKTPIEEPLEDINQDYPQRPPRKIVDTKEIVEDSDEETYLIRLNEEQLITQRADSPKPEEIKEELKIQAPEDPDEITHHEYESISESSQKPLESPPVPPPRSLDIDLDIEKNEQHISPPQRPPRQSERSKTDESDVPDEVLLQLLQEPDIDDEPPPRPPQPHLSYIPSQPPASFYALKAQKYVDTIDDDIPVVPRRRRQVIPPVSRSSSEESAIAPASRRLYRPPEPSIPQLTGQLVRACGSAANSTLKRLITHITNNVIGNADGKQDLHVMMIILLVLIAGLILLGYGDEKTVVHLHHWEYFNPPKDM